MHVARLCLNLSLSLQFMVIDVTTAAARTSSTSALPPLGTGRQPFPRNDKRVGLRLVEKGVFVSQPAQKRSLENKPVECIPPLLQPWVSLYRSIPKIYAPFTDLDVAFTLVSAIFFTCLDYSFALVVQAATGWPLKETRMAAGSLATICHATVLVAGLGVCLLTERYSPSTRMEAHPLWWRDAASALIQFCTGYMVRSCLIVPRFLYFFYQTSHRIYHLVSFRQLGSSTM